MANIKRHTVGETEDQFLKEVGSGPYVGIVKNNLDPTFMGRLSVYIPELGGKPENPQSWIICSYVSPFYGVTTRYPPPGGAIAKENYQGGYQETQQSYGMWAVPPDIETQVLVIFVNKDPSRAYWVGCVPDQFINHMIPGIASRYAQFPDLTEQSPVAEIDKQVATENTNIESLFLDDKVMPTHDRMAEILSDQGLIGDRLRGTSSSSVRREAPSNVFGILTPGRGQDYDENFVPKYRLPGHQFVMDDGDLEGGNQLFRLRSATGHQIVMNDSAGFIYIINASGTAWIEMTDTGRIDIYAKNSISINTDEDFNVNAAGNININSLKEIRSRSIEDTTIESGANIHTLATLSSYHTAVENVNITSGESMYVLSGTDFNLVASSDGFLYAANSLNEYAGVSMKQQSPDMNIKGDNSVKITGSGISLDGPVGSGPHVAPSYDLGGPSGSAGNAEVAAAAQNAEPIDRPYEHVDPNDGTAIPVHNPIVPLAEPWVGHETREAVTKVVEGQINRAEERAVVTGYVPTVTDSASSSKIEAMLPMNWERYREAVAARESAGRYGIENIYGYLGRYQFGVPALVDLGVMTKAAIAKYNENPKFYRNNLSGITKVDAYWSTPPGSKAGFLADTALQDKTFVEFTYKNYSILRGRGVLKANSTAQDIAGALMAAHLGGAAGAAAYIEKGISAKDQLGTSVASYYNLGRSTQV